MSRSPACRGLPLYPIRASHPESLPSGLSEPWAAAQLQVGAVVPVHKICLEHVTMKSVVWPEDTHDWKECRKRVGIPCFRVAAPRVLGLPLCGRAAFARNRVFRSAGTQYVSATRRQADYSPDSPLLASAAAFSWLIASSSRSHSICCTFPL